MFAVFIFDNLHLSADTLKFIKSQLKLQFVQMLELTASMYTVGQCVICVQAV